MPVRGVADIWVMRTSRRSSQRGGPAGVLVLVLVLVACVALLAVAPARAETITLVADEWCPFNCAPGDARPGFLIETARRIFEPQGVRVDYKIVPWARAIRDARAGRYSGLVGAIRSEVPDFVFPEAAAFPSGTHAFVRHGNAWRYAGQASLDGVSVGVILDYSYGEQTDRYLEQHRANDKVQLATGADALEKNVAKLLQGRVDVLLENPAVMQFFLDRSAQQDLIVPAGVLEDTEVSIAFAPGEAHAREHATMLSEGVRRMRASGELAEILGRYGLTPPPRP
jgi:polar amino acid transport system substrate-binding protein